MKGSPGSGSPLSDIEEKVIGCLADGAIRHTNDITALTGFSLHVVNSNLLLLELKRVVAKRADGSYELTS